MIKIIQTSIGLTSISMVLGAWLYVDSYFAKSSELTAVASNLEQSQIQLRIDILEDRIDRESEKQSPNRRRIEKWNSQIGRLEKREEILLKAR